MNTIEINTNNDRNKIILEMETGDIDDILALCYLLQRNDCCIKCILVVPGSLDQVNLIQKIINLFKQGDITTIPIGSYKESQHIVSRNINPLFGFDNDIIVNTTTSTSDILKNIPLEELSMCSFLSIGPLKGFGSFFKNYSKVMPYQFHIKEWFTQGGFAGCNVVTDELILDKFKGIKEIASWNLSGAEKEVKFMLKTLTCPITFISKNVCHGVVYDEELDYYLSKYEYSNKFVKITRKIMGDKYLYSPYKKKMKMIHDLLAVTCFFNRDICQYINIELKCTKNKWRSELNPNTNQKISISYDKTKFLEELVK